jgi:hypothetical protein
VCQTLGGNVAIRGPYRTASIFLSLLKLDFVLGVMLTVLSLFFIVEGIVEITLYVIGCVTTLVWLLVGFALVQRESRRLAPVFFAFAVVHLGILVYKLIEIHVHFARGTDPAFSIDEFMVTGLLAILVRIATIICSALAMRNFGLGLREKMWNAIPAAATTGGRLQAQHAFIGQPTVLVESTEPQEGERSAFRNYLQPLL